LRKAGVMEIVAVEQAKGEFRRALKQSLEPRHSTVPGLCVALENVLSVVRKSHELEHSAVLAPGIILEVVKDADVATLPSDHLQEFLDMAAQVARLPIVEESRIETAARNVSAVAPLSHQRPRPTELAHCFVAIHEMTLVERRNHVQRIAHADDELRPRPDAK